MTKIASNSGSGTTDTDTDTTTRVFITYAKKLDKLSHEQQKSTAPSPAPPRYLIHAFSTSEGSIKSRGGGIF